VKLLLDTHIWLWAHLEPERLVARVAGALRSAKNELWLSPISVWEALLLFEKRRLRVESDPATWIEEAYARVPMHEAVLTREIAAHSRLVDVPHQDPADRFLAATAAVLELTLVTSDENLVRGRGYRVLANTRA
jgi:PIN domain nuclease of toxin-antitoxin system